MRGCTILFKRPDFLLDLVTSLERNNIESDGDEASVRISSSGDAYILFSGRGETSELVGEEEMPAYVLEQGYDYFFLADCRSEEFFVEIFGNPDLGLDMLIWDNDGAIYRPDQLDAKTLKL